MSWKKRDSEMRQRTDFAPSWSKVTACRVSKSYVTRTVRMAAMLKY